jgi:hypothetical protein
LCTCGCIFVRKDGCLDSSTISNSLIRVYLVVQLFAIEVLCEHFLDLRDSCRATNKDDVVDLALAESSVLQCLLNRWHTFSEERKAEFLEFGSRDTARKVFSLSECITEYF